MRAFVQVEPGVSAAQTRPAPPSKGLAILAIAATLAVSIGSIDRSGIWDPVELETAELARRMAHGIFGAEGLSDGVDDGLPTRGELGRGELPFTAVAIGFRLFGLSAWAGRLPLCLFGIAGLFALQVLVRRLAGARASWLAVLALSTTPLYFLHTRTMQGDIVLMAAQAGAMAGLGLLIFEPLKRSQRGLALFVAVISLAAGFGARGVLIGVAIPALGAGIAWLVLALGGARQGRFGDGAGLASLAAGLAALAVGATALVTIPEGRYSMLLAAFGGTAQLPETFEVLARNLGHALFPWSAVVPWALGRLCSPAVAAPGVRVDRVQALRVLLITSGSVAFATQSWLAPELGWSAFAAPAALAGIAALALHDLDFGAPPSRAFAACVAALGLILLVDFKNLPEKALVAFSLLDSAVPESFAAQGFYLLAPGAVLSFVSFSLLVQESKLEGQVAFKPESYSVWPRILFRLWTGKLLLALLLVLSLLLSLELLFAISERVPALGGFDGSGGFWRAAARLGFVLVLGVCVAPLVVLAARDAVRVVLAPAAHSAFLARHAWLGWFSPGRGAVAAVALGASGVIASAAYYPALMDQLSPERTLHAYQRFQRDQEPLGVLGIGARALRYHAGGRVRELADTDSALQWLLEGDDRRFLLLRGADLAALNSGFRDKQKPTKNLPVLDARSSEIVLAVSRLEPGESDQNPLASTVLDRGPDPIHKLDVELGGKLQVLGWDVLDARGRNADSLLPGDEYEFVIYYRVIERLAGNWDTFVHIDGHQRRFNADHPTLGGRYPLSFWRSGDQIADRHTIRLEPHFAPGVYQVYFGLYRGSRRLEVRRGPHQENRIIAGTIRIR